MDVLLVDDNLGDTRMMQLVFEEVFTSARLHIARDGLEALAFLRRSGPNENAPRPDFILLDLNMPKMNGQELLAEIKKDAGLRIIPVVILTSSRAEEDVVESYSLHASGYLRKPVDFKAIREIIGTVGKYWSTVILPRPPIAEHAVEPLTREPTTPDRK
jgi:chemotaxis family two-component system response regulator Rcp1